MRFLRRPASRATPLPLPPHAARIGLLARVETQIATLIAASPGVETGGVLVGFDDSALNAIVVVGASGPGPKAWHARTGFNRDARYCQRWLDACVVASGGTLDFVGEWHSHPEPTPAPSATDLRSHTKLAANPACHRRVLVMLIAGSAHRDGDRGASYTHSRVWSVRPDGAAVRPLEILPDSAYRDLLVAIEHAERVVADRGRAPGGEPPVPA